MAENKVRFNLKNVHYAVAAEGTGGAITYDSPVAVPGAVSLDLSAEGDLSKFYADGIVYYSAAANMGYAGSLEIARIPDQMYQDIWGFTLGTTSKVITENANAESATFALMFEIDGDTDEEYYVLYACTATRPSMASQTLEDTKEPITQSVELTAVPRADGKVMARTTVDSGTTVKSGWFSTVFVETT